MSNEFWAAAARDWVYYQAPLRPSEKVVASYRQVLGLLPEPKPNRANYVRILGVTPETISLFPDWPEGSPTTPWAVTCVDSSQDMIDWVGKPTKRLKQPVTFNFDRWSSSRQEVHLILADDVLLQTPTRELKWFFRDITGEATIIWGKPEKKTSHLSWDGLLAIRSLQSTKATVQDVVARIDSQINSVHSLKWELAAALQLRVGTKNLGVSASYVYDVCHQIRSAGACSACSSKTGWQAPDWGSLDSYKDSTERLYFHTETEIITAAVAAGLTLVHTYTGDYDDGRDNILVFQKDRENYYQNTQTTAVHEHY